MAEDNTISFLKDRTCFSGVIKIAEKVKDDIFAVSGNRPKDFEEQQSPGLLVVYGTIGNSELLDEYEEKGVISFEKIRGKREVFGFFVLDKEGTEEKTLVIAGSDKRGTIYGLFHLSELIGVSPLISWNHVKPKPGEIIIKTSDSMISKEPSVRYRGFFINDEWPAFGNWAREHFGGINAECYERVFELLLRLKGNYLWPAMWASCFNLDGPGLKSAELADEYGIVMSTSHHEPCMRAGEEFNIFKETNPEYGDRWDFRANEEGVTSFWRDGLIRNRNYENVITMGMRGERDTAILGKEATLKDNIDLLRAVLKRQNSLIRENINEDLDKVPRQIVLFTEVEEFFYGDGENEGLFNDPELEGVTLMFSDNNFGYTRTLPSEKMRKHKGGFGMYYHMDMHGGAYSYQWIGSTYLPRVWEQMTQAYEYGVREIWVTNIGDIGTQEYGLSFFLDLAYDIEKWGGNDCSVTKEYTEKWVSRHFSSAFDKEELSRINRLIWGYTGLLEKRKHEIMNAEVYHPVHYGEAEKILSESEALLREANALKKVCSKEHMSAYISLVYYPVCGTANLMKMWILAGRNKFFAEQNRIEANLISATIDECMKEDEKLISEYETVDNGFYKGFGDSLHIGFVNWNDEDCKGPVRHLVYPAKGPRMILTRPDRGEYSTGTIWCDRKQVWNDLLREDRSEIVFTLANGGDESYIFTIGTESEILSFSKKIGVVNTSEDIIVFVDKSKLSEEKTLSFTVEAYDRKSGYEAFAKTEVLMKVGPSKHGKFSTGTYVENDGYISFPGIGFVNSTEVEGCGFRVLEPYGRSKSAIKVFPVTADFYGHPVRPYVEYRFAAKEEAQYNIRFYLAPTTPVVFERIQYLGYSLNEEEITEINTVENEDIPFFLSPQWEREAKNNIKIVDGLIRCKKGENRLFFYASSPGIVLEKIVIWQNGVKLPESYLGPSTSYIV